MSWRDRAAAVLLALVLVAGAGCGSKSHPGDEADSGTGDPIVPVRLAALEERSFPDQVIAPGQWRSTGELVISAPTAGVIESLGVFVGDRVEAGQRIGELVTRDSWAELQGAQMVSREANGNGARDAAAREEAARALALAQRELVRLSITAPRAGVVVRRSIEPGAQAAEAAELLAIAPLNSIVFEAHVTGANAARVRAGQAAQVAGAGSAPREATVQRVLPMANSADQATLVWLAPRGATAAPELERFGTAAITVGAAHRAIGVPDSALVEDDLTGQHRIAVVGADGRASWVTVTAGAMADGWREVSGASLAAGAQVVVEGQRGLPDRTRVQARP